MNRAEPKPPKLDYSALPAMKRRRSPKERLLILGWILATLPIFLSGLIAAVALFVLVVSPKHIYRVRDTTVVVQSDGIVADVLKLALAIGLATFGLTLLVYGMRKAKESTRSTDDD